MAASLASSRGEAKAKGERQNAPVRSLHAVSKGTKKPFLTRPSRKRQKTAPEAVRSKDDEKDGNAVQWMGSVEQAKWMTSQFYAVCGSKVAPLERQPLPESSTIQLSQEKDHSIENLSWHVKISMGPSWKEVLVGSTNSGVQPEKEAGSPSLIVFGSSAIRCVELLRGLAPFTKMCKPAKLFAKHIKVEEQVMALKNRVNIAAGTPNRVRKLVDIGVLNLGRLEIIVLDMHRDAKGLTLLSVPEVMAEFWELYMTHLHQLVVNNQCRLMLY